MQFVTFSRTDDLNRPVQSLNRTHSLVSCIVVTLALLTACDAVITPTPTQIISGPTLAASATVHISTSEELYGTEVAFGGNGQNNATTAPIPSRGSMPPIIRATAVGDSASKIEIFLEDTTSVLGDLYMSSDALERGPGLLLIGPENSVWGDVPRQMWAAGMTVLVVPLRVIPADTDLRSLLTSLSELPTVDPSRVGMVVQGAITDMMFKQCAHEGFCKFAALIGPQDRDTLLGSFNAYQPRPLFVASGNNDTASTTAAIALASVAPQATAHLVSRPTLGADSLQSNSSLVSELVAWVSAALVSSPEVLPTIERG